MKFLFNNDNNQYSITWTAPITEHSKNMTNILLICNKSVKLMTSMETELDGTYSQNRSTFIGEISKVIRG